MPTIDTGPAALDLLVYAGDLNRIDLEVTADDPVDLTDAVIAAQARTTAASPEVALAATVVEGELLLGRFALEWDGEQVRDLLAGADTWSGVWDLSVHIAGENLPRTLLRGTFTAQGDVTRDEGVPG